MSATKKRAGEDGKKVEKVHIVYGMVAHGISLEAAHELSEAPPTPFTVEHPVKVGPVTSFSVQPGTFVAGSLLKDLGDLSQREALEVDTGVWAHHMDARAEELLRKQNLAPFAMAYEQKMREYVAHLKALESVARHACEQQAQVLLNIQKLLIQSKAEVIRKLGTPDTKKAQLRLESNPVDGISRVCVTHVGLQWNLYQDPAELPCWDTNSAEPQFVAVAVEKGQNFANDVLATFPDMCTGEWLGDPKTMMVICPDQRECFDVGLDCAPHAKARAKCWIP